MDNFQFKKKYGQNFLRDETIPSRIVSSSEIPSNTLVVEIGPGAGILTKQLSHVAQQVVSYEVDKELKPVLEEYLKDCKNIEVIYDDFLNRELKDDLKEYSYDSIYVIANLPYYITTPILMKLINANVIIDKIVIMVQKEVGDRFCAKIGSKAYGSITVYLNYYFDIKRLFDISRECFVPKPNVDSVILSLTRKKELPFVSDFSLFTRLVRDSFQFKRKTLMNNLRSYDVSIIKSVLEKHHYPLNVRAEQLPLEMFIEISEVLYQNGSLSLNDNL